MRSGDDSNWELIKSSVSSSFRRKISLTVFFKESQKTLWHHMSRAEPAFSAHAAMREFLHALGLALELIACKKTLSRPKLALMKVSRVI